MRRYLAPGVIFFAAAAGIYALGGDPMFWLPLALAGLATLWWMVVAARAEPPLALHLPFMRACLSSTGAREPPRALSETARRVG